MLNSTSCCVCESGCSFTNRTTQNTQQRSDRETAAADSLDEKESVLLVQEKKKEMQDLQVIMGRPSPSVFQVSNEKRMRGRSGSAATCWLPPINGRRTSRHCAPPVQSRIWSRMPLTFLQHAQGATWNLRE